MSSQHVDSSSSAACSPLIWILADDRAGNVSQCLGIAERLELPFIRKDIRYNRFARLPNFLQGASLIALDTSLSSPLLPPFPDLIIAAGRRTAPIARYLKKQHPRSFWLHLMWPGAVAARHCDLIAVPEHDHCTAAENIFSVIGAPHRVTQSLLHQEAAKWKERYAAKGIATNQSPHIVLLIGGDTRYGSFTVEHARYLGRHLSMLVSSMGGTLWLTTSRRTSKEAEEALLHSLSCNHVMYDWRSGEENPYFGFLGMADFIVVTGDSMSMCSEACATGKPVTIFAPVPRGFVSDKHRRLHETLYKAGCARPFEGVLEQWNYQPLDVAGQLVEKLRNKVPELRTPFI